MTKLYEVEPMHQRPKDAEGFFWDKEVECKPEENDLYVGKGATYCPFQTYYPYTVVEVTGKLGNRIAKLRDCDENDGEYVTRGEPKLWDYSTTDGYLYIKEKDISFKKLSGIWYDKVYEKNLDTNRLRIRGGSVKVGERRWHVPREI